MRHDEYRGFDGLGLAELVRTRQVSATDLLDLALSRAEATDGDIAAVVHVQADRARRAIAAGLPDGAFTGVPFLIKDLGCEATDFPTFMGSRLYRDYRYGFDSELFTRLERAGLVTFARTTSPEFGIGPTAEGGAYGRPTRNPWNLGHVAGGSSAGSAAAVAAGVVPIAHGSDGGGSVRIPASSCGLFGLKPTRARLPDGPTAGEGWAGMAIDGFLTRTVRDTAALIDATQGPDVGAPYYAPPLDGTLLGAIAAEPRRLRIAFSTKSFTGDPVHPDCRTAIDHTAAKCAALGHEMVEADPNIDIYRFMRAWTDIVACGTELTVRSREDELGRAARTDELDGVTRGAVTLGRTLRGSDYLAAVNTVHAIGREMARFFADEHGFDMLLTSTLAEPPAEIGRFKPDNEDFLDYRMGPNGVLGYSPFTALANGTGQPAISVPLYWNDGGLPIGTHFMARAGEEALLMQLAAQLERCDPWFDRIAPL
ncbi:MAG TPA: amidase [Ilumatobacteraceae bacterium]|jgi:amidase/6-aminohexanoate-cyclic-dimer hydrolase